MSKKVAFHNLGCKVNSYELDVMRQILLAEGYAEVPFQEKADIYVVNTCTVTNIADRKSRQMLHRAKKQNPDAVVVAVGCYVETDPERVEKDPAIDLVIGNNRKTEIGRILTAFLREKGASEKSPSRISPRGCRSGDRHVGKMDPEKPKPEKPNPAKPKPEKPKPEKPKPEKERAEKAEKAKPVYTEDLARSPEFERMHLTSPGHTRAYIKIQDGCNQFCSYCIIPFARGRIRSRAPEEILEEVEGLVETGIREVVLTGIHVSSYGLDFDAEGPVRFDPVRSGRALLDLIGRLHAVSGLERIRLGSLEPRIMTEDFISGLAALEKVCPHFHLSLQSGCDATLRRMNRHYTTAEYAQSVELLRRYYDRPAITTDVIVGFPGETEAEFAQTCTFLEKIRFYEIHVFRYSRRNGTAAAKMEFQIPEPVKVHRSEKLLALTAGQAEDYRGQFAGEPETVLLEECLEQDGKRYWTGSTMRYVTAAVPVETETGDGCAEEADGYHPGMLLRGTFLRESIELSRGTCQLFARRHGE